MESSIFTGAKLAALYHTVITWLLTEVFTADNVIAMAMQIPAVVGSGFGAWWVHDFFYPVLRERIERSSLPEHSRELLLILASLIFPVLWAAGLLIAATVAAHFGWPHNVMRVALNLCAAWIFIRIATIWIRDPIWARALVVVTFTVAALNILHLLVPAMDLMDRIAVTIGQLRISMLTVVNGMLSLGVLLWVAVLLSGILERRIQRLPNLTPSVQVLIGKLFKATLITIAIVVALTSIGIDLTALAVFSGAIGVGIGFGLQKVVSNLISGIILLMDKSIKPGDILRIGETYGWVSSLGARYIAIETRDGTKYLIPNEDVITKQVLNWSHTNDLARLRAQVIVSYDTDIPKALKLMAQAAEKPSRVVKIPKPNPLVIGFGQGYVDLELRFWIRDVHNGIRNVTSEVYLEIWRLFREHDITVPYPQRGIHIHSMPQRMAAREPFEEESPSLPRPAGAMKSPSAPHPGE